MIPFDSVVGRTLALSALAAVLVVALVFSRPSFDEPFLSSRRSMRQRVRVANDAKVCDPFAEPGFLSWDGDREHDSLNGRFIPLTTHCAEAPDWLTMLRTATERLEPKPKRPGVASDQAGVLSEAGELVTKWEAKEQALRELDFLRGQTILVIGDSVDRNGLWQLAWHTRQELKVTSYANSTFDGVPEGWDERGVPHCIDMPELDCLFTNVFFYGVDDTDDFATAADWRPPGLYEQRVETLFLPYTAQLDRPPSYIQVHSGMWDLALFGRADVRNGISTQRPLSLERLDYYKRRLHSMIRATQEAYPGRPIRLRKLHRVGIQFAYASGDYTSGMQGVAFPQDTNYFTDMRIAQLRVAQEAVAKELGIHVFDFGAIFEGWQDYQDKVHPLPLPGVFAYALPLLHHIWMESQGRDSWLPPSSAFVS